jgi:hypothetical protein
VNLQLGVELSSELRTAAADRGMSVGKLVEQMVQFALPHLRPVDPSNLFTQPDARAGTQVPTNRVTGSLSNPVIPPRTVPNEHGEPVEVH